MSPESDGELEDLRKANQILHALITNLEAEIKQLRGHAQSPREPAAWRTTNDYGHWHYTDNPVLADTWIKIEKFDVQPLYADTSTTQNSEG